MYKLPLRGPSGTQGVPLGRIQIKMHERDRALIQSIQDFFGGIGYVSKPNNRATVEFRVSTLNDIINIIIPHFDNYPLASPPSPLLELSVSREWE